jgi:hypothetical protein
MKLTDLKVIYVCPNHNPKYRARKEHMDTMLRAQGFTDIVHFTSGHEAYPDCLSIATIDIFETYMNDPFLLLEDDVEPTSITEFTFDTSADAIYFGLSKCGGSRTINLHEGGAKYEPWSESQVRITNMLATHAILYISPRYKKAIVDILRKNMGTKYHSDVLISRIQPEFTVLALKQPAFFQSNRFNAPHNLEAVTKFAFN